MLNSRMEKPSQRLHYRVVAPLQIAVDGHPATTKDWSIGGFRAEVPNLKTEPGATVPVEISIPFQGFYITFEVEASVLRHDPSDGAIAAKFLELSERSRDLMEHFVENIVRGSMTTAEDTIRRIDTPVTPVSTKPDKNPLTEMPARRWPVKRIFMISFYSAIGFALFGYILISVAALLTSVEVKTAVVTAPIETILATTSGIIVDTPVNEGAAVEDGTIMMRIQDANLEEAIDRARIKVLGAEAEVQQRVEEFDRALSFYDSQRIAAGHEMELAQVQIADFERRTSILRDQRDRMEELLRKGLTVRAKVDVVEEELSKLQAELQAARAHAAYLRNLDEIGKAGMLAGQSGLDDTLLAANEAVGQSELLLERVNMELAALQRQRDRISVAAPGRGRLIRRLKSVGSGVKRGEEIAFFEKSATFQIEAYLTHDELAEVDARSRVTVYLPTEDLQLNATVISVDRESAYVDHGKSRYLWRQQLDRTVRVTLEPDRTFGLNRPGIPATIFFEKRGWAQKFRAWLGWAPNAQDQDIPLADEFTP